MRIGDELNYRGTLMGPPLPDPVLDIPTSFRQNDYAKFLGLLALQRQQEVQIRVTALEPPAPVPLLVTLIVYPVFPTLETFDLPFTVQPVVHLQTTSGLATYESNARLIFNLTFDPYMNKLFFGSVNISANTNTSIGSGISNTNAVESVVTESGAAARVILSFDYNGFNDWFIPSHDELIEIYNNLALLPEITADIAADILTVAASSSEAAAPDAAIKIRVVDMTDGTNTNTVLKCNQANMQDGSVQGSFIPVRVYNSDVAVNVGDVGEGGGIVFLVDLGMQTGFSGSAGTAVGTSDLIGDGETNQTAWVAAVTDVNAQCSVVNGLVFGAKTDWFIPAHDELIEIYNNLAIFPVLDAAVTATDLDIVSSSSEADAPDDDTDLKTVEFSTGTNTNTVFKLTLADRDNGDLQGAVIPARYIDNSVGAFTVGDAGPGGGIVFYDAGSQQTWGRYIEAIDGWYRCFEVIDKEQGSWYYDRVDYLTTDLNEQFFPADEFQNPPYLDNGVYEVYANGGVCTYPNIGIAQNLFYVEEAVVSLNAEYTNGFLLGSKRIVVVSTLAAP